MLLAKGAAVVHKATAGTFPKLSLGRLLAVTSAARVKLISLLRAGRPRNARIPASFANLSVASPVSFFAFCRAISCVANFARHRMARTEGFKLTAPIARAFGIVGVEEIFFPWWQQMTGCRISQVESKNVVLTSSFPNSLCRQEQLRVHIRVWEPPKLILQKATPVAPHVQVHEVHHEGSPQVRKNIDARRNSLSFDE